MISRRSAKGPYYECQDCGDRIHRAAYRASCPACDGRLRSVRAAPDGIGSDEDADGAGGRE